MLQMSNVPHFMSPLGPTWCKAAAKTAPSCAMLDLTWAYMCIAWLQLGVPGPRAQLQLDQLAPTWAVHVGANWSELGAISDSLGAGGTRREATRIFGLQYFFGSRIVLGLFVFPFLMFFGSVFLPILLAVCSILELEAAVSAVFAAFLNSNLWFSMEFATFCCSNCSCNMIVCNYRVHVGLVLGLV